MTPAEQRRAGGTGAGERKDVMPKFRKKPVTIEAVRILGYTQLLPAFPGHPDGEVLAWMKEHGGTIKLCQEEPGPAFGLISTLEGVMRADIGDWIIKGVAGEFYPCKDSIFQATYEPVDESP